ncbi:MAG: AAA family ATPase [Tepidisphaeraceae bacterium]|jgi:AAA ATPase-like protein/putative AbiEii toxin of type IV toxin-antitoxin system
MLLKSFEIENFRGFRRLQLSGWPRINLISGKNNTGKTALLEAIYLQMGPLQPQLATGFAHRGEGSGTAPVLPMGLRYFDEWRDLFFNQAIFNPIKLSSVLANETQHTLNILLREAQVQLIEPPSRREEQSSGSGSSDTGPATTQEPNLELVYLYTNSSGSNIETVATPSVVGTGIPRERLAITRNNPKRSDLPKATFLGTTRQPRWQVAESFSELLDTEHRNSIEAILRRLEPRLREIEIRVTARRPELAANIGLGPLVPLRMMGEGITRLVEILVAIYRTPGGIVLIDEIENGLHYSVLGDVWKAIAIGARDAGVQLMSTTHSWECIRAAHNFFAGDSEYDLGLHRLDRTANDVVAVTYDRKTIEASLNTGIEVR